MLNEVYYIKVIPYDKKGEDVALLVHKSENLLWQCLIVLLGGGTVNNFKIMKKLMFLAALAFSGVASVSVQGAEEPTRNAVCVQLSSGDAKYVAFTDNPVINSKDGKLVVSDLQSQKELLLSELSEVSSITAVYHDFTVTDIQSMKENLGREVKAIFDLSGKQVSKVIPGQVYILKFTDGSTQKIAK